MRYLLSVFLLVLGFSSYAKVGYVDVTVVLNKTKQGQKLKSRMESELKKIKKQMQSTETRLKKERAKLEKELKFLTEAKRAEKIQKFQQEVMQSQRSMETKRNSLQQLEAKLTQPIIERLEKVVSSVATKAGYSVVKNKDKNTIWVDSKLDLTKKVYKQYNRKYR